jgi:hypothetical protein
MAEDEVELDEDPPQPAETAEVAASRAEFERRCNAAKITINVLPGFEEGEIYYEMSLPAGRETRPLYVSPDGLPSLLAIPFEDYIFLSGYEAICSYKARTIEVGVRVLGGMSQPAAERKLLSLEKRDSASIDRTLVTLESPDGVLPQLEIGPPTEAFLRLSRTPLRRLTLKLSGSSVKTHDESLALVQKLSNGVLFQIDLYADLPLGIERQRRPIRRSRLASRQDALSEVLQYPKTEFDEAPMSLYWYARSAESMPLLQFLAFYQTIEFYFPTYSKAEAARRLRSILKDPTFRGDRDADIGRLLAAIQVGRGNAFGDERTQLRAAIMECVDPQALRNFIEASPARNEHFVSKSKSLNVHRLPLANQAADLRGDVAERIYDIRCKIVHTKNDARDGEIELLLPFTKEADLLSHDIDLVQYIAQRVLIAASTNF